MIIPDKSSVFEDTAVCVKEDAKEGLVASEEKTLIENKIWDGEALLDTSVFEENGFEEKGMLTRTLIFLQNHIFPVNKTRGCFSPCFYPIVIFLQFNL